jgi:hypothetical protein
MTGRDAPVVALLRKAGRGDPGQDQFQRMGEHPLEQFDERVERGRRAGAQSLCARPLGLRIVERIGRGGGGEPRAGGDRDRDRRLGGLPLGDERAGRIEADARHGQPHHVVPISHSQDTPGPMGRSVKDVAILFSAMVGKTIPLIRRPRMRTNIARIMPRELVGGCAQGYARRLLEARHGRRSRRAVDDGARGAARGGRDPGRGEDAQARGSGRCRVRRCSTPSSRPISPPISRPRRHR